MMSASRRDLIGASLVLLSVSKITSASTSMVDERLDERQDGNPRATVTVQEWFSLTCDHCARFSRAVFPIVKTELIDSGRIRYVYRDFPLDHISLIAAMVARSLPVGKYDAFIQDLLLTQEEWAFSVMNDPATEIGKKAALFGMSEEAFQKAIADDLLKRAILARRDSDHRNLGIRGTPSFKFGSTLVTGEMDYKSFMQRVSVARDNPKVGSMW